MFRDYDNSPRRLAVMAARLSRLPMARHPAMRIAPRREGYRAYAFGGKAGPDMSVDNVFHELAHAVEFGPDEFKKRASAFGFLFRNRRVEVLGQLYVEPLTWQSTQREIRTMAIQLHLLRSAGSRISEDFFAREHLRSMQYMTDWYNVPGKTEEKRFEAMTKEFFRAYGLLNQDMVLHRLELWLDRTRQRLKRPPKSEVSYFTKDTVMRLDASGQFQEEPVFA